MALSYAMNGQLVEPFERFSVLLNDTHFKTKEQWAYEAKIGDRQLFRELKKINSLLSIFLPLFYSCYAFLNHIIGFIEEDELLEQYKEEIDFLENNFPIDLI